MGTVGHMSNVIVGIDADSSLTGVDWRRRIPDVIKGDLLVARRVCRIDMEDGPHARFSADPRARPKQRRRLRGSIKPKAGRTTATAFHRDRRLGHWPGSILTRLTCFRRHEFNNRARNIALEGRLDRHLQACGLCLQGAISRHSGIAQRPMPTSFWGPQLDVGT